jgi:hypothetical protein
MPAEICCEIPDIRNCVPFALSFRNRTLNKPDLTTNACTLYAFLQAFRTFGCAFVAFDTTSRAFFASVSRHEPNPRTTFVLYATPLLGIVCKVG